MVVNNEVVIHSFAFGNFLARWCLAEGAVALHKWAQQLVGIIWGFKDCKTTIHIDGKRFIC